MPWMASLPSGTVTFLFTDIEGSTRLVQSLGETYGDVLRQQRAVLREHLGNAGGREIDTQGDAFFFSFTRARDAIAGAVAAQRALAAHDWPSGAEVKVRMGLHTGEPSVGDEGYHGIDVVRAARIRSAARGGQILVSDSTRAIAGGSLPDGVRFRDLGEQRLKDIEPERLYQVAFDGGDADVPALKQETVAAHARSRADALAATWQQRLESRIDEFVQTKLAEAQQVRERAVERQLADRPERRPAHVRPPKSTRTLSGVGVVVAVTVLALGAAVIALILLVKFVF